jgi:hypothetical protein
MASETHAQDMLHMTKAPTWQKIFCTNQRQHYYHKDIEENDSEHNQRDKKGVICAGNNTRQLPLT